MQVDGKSIEFDKDGFMLDPNVWNEQIAAAIAGDEGTSVRDIYKLFTSGPARGACRIAGLPKPDGCV